LPKGFVNLDERVSRTAVMMNNDNVSSNLTAALEAANMHEVGGTLFIPLAANWAQVRIRHDSQSIEMRQLDQERNEFPDARSEWSQGISDNAILEWQQRNSPVWVWLLARGFDEVAWTRRTLGLE
ncbi:MAG: hypothetical protein ABI972_19905, partial [Acidobacteriota bacterium]